MGTVLCTRFLSKTVQNLDFAAHFRLCFWSLTDSDFDSAFYLAKAYMLQRIYIYDEEKLEEEKYFERVI